MDGISIHVVVTTAGGVQLASGRAIITGRPMPPAGLDSSLPFALTRLAGQLSSAMISSLPNAFESILDGALRQIAETLDADRCSLFTFDDDEQGIEIAHFWYRPGTPPIDPKGDAERLPWVMASLARGHQLILDRIPECLPPEATAELTWLDEFPVKSALLLPVVVAGRRTAVMVVASFRDYLDLSEDVVTSMLLIGEILASALHRVRQARALEATASELDSRSRRESLRPAGRAGASQVPGYDDFVGQGAAMREVIAQVAQVAPTDATVLVLGETGTGKELVARAIHQHSARRDRPFIRVNCAALPATLIESELFGHERGAFTGALSLRVGRFELADRGTIFLDEVGDLPAEVQAKLLRVVQEREFERLGSSQTRKVDVRIVAATHRDLAAMVKAEQFRADLYYRLSVFPVRLPPLRERREDVAPLVWRFIERRQQALQRTITTVPADVMAALEAYAWPGNVRELQNVVERAMIQSRDGVLQLDSSLRVPAESPNGTPRSESIADVERAHIHGVLLATKWRINGPGNAAERLSMHPNTLRFRMKKLGISRPPAANRADGA
jgi:formate hydrogenlyase transcriptional activator